MSRFNRETASILEALDLTRELADMDINTSTVSGAIPMSRDAGALLAVSRWMDEKFEIQVDAQMILVGVDHFRTAFPVLNLNGTYIDAGGNVGAENIYLADKATRAVKVISGDPIHSSLIDDVFIFENNPYFQMYYSHLKRRSLESMPIVIDRTADKPVARKPNM